MSAFRNRPYLIALPLIVTTRAEKSGLPTIAAMSGVNTSATKDETTAPKASKHGSICELCVRRAAFVG